MDSFGATSEIAILSEDETVYGDIGYPPPDNQHDWLALRYPREIARLRNAASLEASDKSKQEPPSQNGVPLALSDTPSGAAAELPETVGTFSALQSPASQQAVLLNIASTLRRERAAYAGIIATDIRDALFLARFLRSADPDTRIFSFDSDLLFLREAESAPLTGTLSITDYPLFSRNQHWTQEQRRGYMPRRIQFASRNAEATYNAVRRAMCKIEFAGHPEQCPESNSKGEIYLEYERPFKGQACGRQEAAPLTTPPLWLTVLGRDGYWPVALLDESDARQPCRYPQPCNAENRSCSTLEALLPHTRDHSTDNLRPEQPSRGWFVIFWMAWAFAVSHGVYVWRLLAAPEGLACGPRSVRALGKLFSAYPNTKPTQYELPFLLAATVSLPSALAVFSFPMAPFVSLCRCWPIIHLAAALVCILFLFVLGVRLSSKKPYLFTVIAVWIVGPAVLVVWALLIVWRPYHAGFFMAYRGLYLGSGVSPGIPIMLLCAAFYGWAWANLKREFAGCGRRSAPVCAHERFPELCTLEKETDNEIQAFNSSRIRLPAAVSLVLWLVLLRPTASLRSIENYWYDLLYTFVLIAVFWCMCLTLVQFFRIWQAFSNYLQAIERLPVRNAFSRLPKEISWIPLVSVPHYKYLFISGRTEDCLRAVHAQLGCTGKRPDRHVAAALSEIISTVRSRMHQPTELLAATSTLDQRLYDECQSYLDRAEREIVRHLEPAWERGDSDSLRQEQEQHKNGGLSERDKLLILEEEFVALRLLVFIRYVIRQLRNLVGFLGAGLIIVVISLNSYPFQAHRWIGLSSIVALVATGVVIAVVFAGMDRDAILSRLTDTKANEIGRNFFFRLARFGALPTLTVLAAQFPAVNHFLFSWIQPALEALK